jgi:3'(2'), 5'-bisphosphate nucleotidase
MTDHELAARLATEAGELLLGVRAELADATAAERKDAGDKRAHRFLMDALAAERPDDAVLSEEATEEERANSKRLTAERVWIVDPLDGTREFGELGRDDWAVHVSLWARQGGLGELVAGAVALPAQGVTLATPDVAPPPAAPAKPRIVVSRTRPPAVALAVRDALDGVLVEMGSAGAKVASVVQGIADAYVHAGGQYEWDSAAPVAVARAAGLFTSRLDGSPLEYNRPDPLLPDLVVCRPELADAVLAVTTRR